MENASTVAELIGRAELLDDVCSAVTEGRGALVLGGSGMGKTDSVLHALCPSTVNWKPGKRLASSADVGAWIKSLNL